MSGYSKLNVKDIVLCRSLLYLIGSSGELLYLFRESPSAAVDLCSWLYFLVPWLHKTFR